MIWKMAVHPIRTSSPLP